MDWFAQDVSILRSPKIWQAAADLKISPPTLVGHISGIFGLLASHGDEKGMIRELPDELLEFEAMWKGKPGLFAEKLRHHFMDPDGTLHGWQGRNGAMIAKHKADALKKRIERASAARAQAAKAAKGDAEVPDNPPNVSGPSADSPQTVHGPARVHTDRQTDGQTDGRSSNPPTTTSRTTRKPRASSGSGESWLSPIAEAHESIMGVGSFAPIQGQFLKHWQALYHAHGAEKCARVWKWANESATEKERKFLTPANVAARFNDFDPDRPSPEARDGV